MSRLLGVAVVAAALVGCGSSEEGEKPNLAPAVVVDDPTAPPPAAPPPAAEAPTSGKEPNGVKGVAPNGRTSR